MHLLLSRIVGYGLITVGVLFGWLPILPGILLVLFGIYVLERPKIDRFAANVRNVIGYETYERRRNARLARRSPRKR